MGEDQMDWEDMFAQASFGLALLAPPDYRLTRANPALLQMAGREFFQLEGRPLLPLLVGVPSSLPPVGLAGDVLPVTLEGAVACWLRISVSPAGQNYLAIIEDVSEQKALEEQMLHADRLYHLGGLATTLQHDLSQPLNIIRLTVENALDRLEETPMTGEELPRQMRCLSIVLQQLKRTQEIFDQTWAYGHPPESDQEMFDPARSIATAIERVRTRPSAAKVAIGFSTKTTLPRLLGHGQRLEEVLFQLLLNSCEAMTSRKVNLEENSIVDSVSIDCAVDADHGLLMISVADNGPGLPAALARRLDRPAFASQPSGKGLGLLVAFGIVAEMGGWIRLPKSGNSPEKGARFDILLPLDLSLGLDVEDETPPNEEETK
jgi:signal transduction histidine kinase